MSFGRVRNRNPFRGCSGPLIRNAELCFGPSNYLFVAFFIGRETSLWILGSLWILELTCVDCDFINLALAPEDGLSRTDF